MRPSDLPRYSSNLACFGTFDGSPGPDVFRFPWYFVLAESAAIESLGKAASLSQDQLLKLISPDILLSTGPQLSEREVVIDRLQKMPQQSLRVLTTGHLDNLASKNVSYIFPPWRSQGPDANELDQLTACLQSLKGRCSEIPNEAPSLDSLISMAWLAIVNTSVLYEELPTKDNPRIHNHVVRSALYSHQGDARELAETCQLYEIVQKVQSLSDTLLADEELNPDVRVEIEKLQHPRDGWSEHQVLATAMCIQHSKIKPANSPGPYTVCWDETWNEHAVLMLNRLRKAAHTGVPMCDLGKTSGRRPCEIVRDLNRRGGSKMAVAKDLRRLREKHRNGRYYLYSE